MDAILIRCKVTCDTMSIIRGDTCVLPLPKARVLASTGKVQIIDSEMMKKKTIVDTNYLFKRNFSQRRLTRVSWVQNYNKNGGAEISNFNAIQVGQRLGFDIVGEVLGDSTFSYKNLNAADIIIVNNLHAAGKEEFIKWLIKSGKPYIKYEHDLIETSAELFKHSKLNVFISPLQLEHYVKLFGEEILERSICLPLAFDTSRWSTEGEHKKNTVLIPTWRKCRHTAQKFIKEHPQFSYDVTGDVMPIGSKVSAIGDVDYVDMQKLYPKYEYVLHMTDEKWSGDRVIFEAIMSGCRVFTNENVGHTSWAFDWKNIDTLKFNLNKAVYTFWERVEKAFFPAVTVSKKTVSIVTRCMRRKEFLKQTLPTWLAQKSISKIIIVDWGATEPLDDLLVDNRVEVLQVKGKETFEQSQSWNVGLRRCSTDFVFMVDVDVKFNCGSYAFDSLVRKVVEGQYADDEYVVCSATPSHLTGTSIFSKALVDKVNGFLEGFPSRGYEEIDFRNRIDKVGGKRMYHLHPGMIEHIDHGDDLRFQNMKEEINILEADKLCQQYAKSVNANDQKHNKVECIVLSKGRTPESRLI